MDYYQKYIIRAKKVKGAQEAHECIRPTDINHKLNDKWQQHEIKLYNLIKKRTIISHMKPALYNVLKIDLSNKNLEEIGVFRGKYKSLKYPGFLIYSNPDIKAEDEIKKLRSEAPAKIKQIAVETSSELIHKLIGADVNNSSITAIVDDFSKKNGDFFTS